MTASTVRRRHVFFLSGFDPKGASHYHGLYRRESALQGAVTGAHYEVGPRHREPGGNTTWQVRCTAADAVSESTIEFVRWDDIVRAHWPRSGSSVFTGSVRGYRAAFASPAALAKVWHASRRTLVSLLLPLVFWLASLLAAVVVGVAVALSMAFWTPTPRALAAGLGLAAAAAVWWAALAWEKRLNTGWLLRIYQFAADWRDARVPRIEARIDALADALAARLLAREDDEVLLVGFSVGSLLAASVAARVQDRAAREGIALDRFWLVTLGHCIPLLGLMAGADAYRAELARLGREPPLQWVDFSSVTDWGSFALVDPLALCLGADAAGLRRPRLASPRFHTMFEPQDYARLVRDKRRMHLQYLMAGQRPALYDYFAITAGAMPLADRLSRLPAS